jgi:transposase
VPTQRRPVPAGDPVDGPATWGLARQRWHSTVVCATPAPPLVFQEDVCAVHAPTERLQRLEQAREAQLNTGRRPPVIAALDGPWGGAVHYDLDPCGRTRLPDARREASPHEERSGPDPRVVCQGCATSAGCKHHSRSHAGPTRAGRRRLGLPRSRQRQAPLATQVGAALQALLDIRWMAQGRRCTRVRRLLARGTYAHQVVVAMARALAGLMRAIANQVLVTPSVHQMERH